MVCKKGNTPLVSCLTRLDTYLQRTRRWEWDVQIIKAYKDIALLLTRASAWWRRRHLLVTVRGRSDEGDRDVADATGAASGDAGEAIPPAGVALAQSMDAAPHVLVSPSTTGSSSMLMQADAMLA